VIAIPIRSSAAARTLTSQATNDIHFATPGRYVSSIGYADSRDGVHFTCCSEPLIVPDQPFEMGLGCEDPRVVRIGDEYFIYYTAVEGVPPDFRVRIALATTTTTTTTDFRTVVKHGVVGPRGAPSKAATLFPELVDGGYLWFFTWCSDTPGSTIMHAKFSSLDDVRKPPPGFLARVVEDYDRSAVLTAGDPADRMKVPRTARARVGRTTTQDRCRLAAGLLQLGSCGAARVADIRGPAGPCPTVAGARSHTGARYCARKPKRSLPESSIGLRSRPAR
jgi:hypothetical protein